MIKFAGIVAGIVSALTLSVGNAMAGSTDFQALKNLSSSALTPMTQTELNGVVGAGYDNDYDYDHDYDHDNDYDNDHDNDYYNKCDYDKYDDGGHHGNHHYGKKHHHGRHKDRDNGYGKY